MVTSNNYMFRHLTGHHQVVHLMKRAEGCAIYINRTFRKPAPRPSSNRETPNLVCPLNQDARHSRIARLVKICAREQVTSTGSNGTIATGKLKTSTRQK